MNSRILPGLLSLITAAALSLNIQAAGAAEAQANGAGNAGQATNAGSSPVAPASLPATGAPAASPASPAAGASAKATLSPKAPAASGAEMPSDACPGPLQADRQKVRNWLVAAKQKGVGIGAYIKVYDNMEAAVRGGAPEAAIKVQLDSIVRAISDQVRESSQAKVFRPIKKQTRPGVKFNVLTDQPPPVWMGEPVDHTTTRRLADLAERNALNQLTEEQRNDILIRKDLSRKRQKVKDWMDERYERKYYHF